MSTAFVEEKKPTAAPSTIQKLLDENAALIQTIVEYQNAGRASEALSYQQTLHRNLLYLAGLVDGLGGEREEPVKMLPDLQKAEPPKEVPPPPQPETSAPTPQQFQPPQQPQYPPHQGFPENGGPQHYGGYQMQQPRYPMSQGMPMQPIRYQYAGPPTSQPPEQRPQ